MLLEIVWTHGGDLSHCLVTYLATKGLKKVYVIDPPPKCIQAENKGKGA